VSLLRRVSRHDYAVPLIQARRAAVRYTFMDTGMGEATADRWCDARERCVGARSLPAVGYRETTPTDRSFRNGAPRDGRRDSLIRGQFGFSAQSSSKSDCVASRSAMATITLPGQETRRWPLLPFRTSGGPLLASAARRRRPWWLRLSCRTRHGGMADQMRDGAPLVERKTLGRKPYRQ
jgi:hypothetical protein